MKTTYNTEPIQSFDEEALGNLLNKEDHAVQLGTAENTVKLATSSANAIGTLVNRYDGNSKQVSVRLFGSEGTFRGKCAGIIQKGDKVTVNADAKFAKTTDAALVVARYIGQVDTADGDIIELLD